MYNLQKFKRNPIEDMSLLILLALAFNFVSDFAVYIV